MPSISVSHLSWSTPDGRPLFSQLDLSFLPERTGLIGRNGVGKSTLLRLLTGEIQPQVGSVIRNATFATLRQSVQVGEGETVASLFGAEAALSLLSRAEAGEATVEELAEADWSLEARMAESLARFGLDLVPTHPLDQLSGGQRTRVALAALVFDRPDFLVLDEPTNNLDRVGRAALIALLSSWHGGAIVVSHDRELLETMDAIVELTTLGATRYGGGYSLYRERKERELASAEHDLADATKRVAEADAMALINAQRQARRDRMGRQRAERGDMPAIVAGGLKMAAEATAGSGARLAEQRRDQAQADLAQARERIEVLQPLVARIASTGLSAGKGVLRASGVTGGHDPERPVIRDLSFEVVGPERTAIVGPNGSGKTTLLSMITGAIQPSAGEIRVQVPFAFLDQSVSLLDPALTIRDNFRRLNADADENACRAALARFMFRADAALQRVGTLSGGQMLRAGLACVLGGVRPPPLLILDEPTNHLDLDSIAAIERGISAYDGALIVVSHDAVFLEAIGIGRRIELG